ncbi:ABC transporter ATP-binding protein [bacterium AH-315-N03]|nr:ABC transporter ATP-binding protein [bacterium AH-315-N03]
MTLDLSILVELGTFRLRAEVVCTGVTAVMGPNGAGKTTLLRACVGAVQPTSGRIILRGRTLYDDRGTNLPPESRNVAYVPQGLGLFPHMSVLENVAFARRIGSDFQKRMAARRLLRDAEIEHLAERRPSVLSGGERQRVALARAMAADPEVLLLDEPLSALDPTARPQVRRFLSRWLAESELPALVVTHDPGDAVAFANELLVLEDGRVTQHGPLLDVAVRPATEFVAALTPGLIRREPGSAPPPSRVSEDE